MKDMEMIITCVFIWLSYDYKNLLNLMKNIEKKEENQERKYKKKKRREKTIVSWEMIIPLENTLWYFYFDYDIE